MVSVLKSREFNGMFEMFKGICFLRENGYIGYSQVHVSKSLVVQPALSGTISWGPSL